jgi:hypothetical protein
VLCAVCRTGVASGVHAANPAPCPRSSRVSGERRAEQRKTLPSWTSHVIECGEPRMPKETFNPEPPGTIGRDFKIFADPGFLVSLALGMLLIGIIAGVLLYFNANDSISPF